MLLNISIPNILLIRIRKPFKIVKLILFILVEYIYNTSLTVINGSSVSV